MKRWTMLLTLALCMLGLVALTGCGGQQDPKVAGKPHRTVAVLFADSSDIWQRGGILLQEELEKNGFIVDLHFARTAQAQVGQFRRAVEQKPIAIVVGAVDGDALKDALSEASKWEIPVVAYDRLIMNSPHVSYYVGYDAQEIGRVQAYSIEKALRLKETHGSDNIEIFAGDPKDNNAHLFYKGAMEVLKPYIDHGRLVVTSGETSFAQVATKNWDPQSAKERARRLLRHTYENDRPLSAILSPNDALAGGIREALDEYYKGTWPFITGLDADPEGVRAIAADRQGMTIDKPPTLPVKECLRLIKDIVAGKTDSSKIRQDNGSKGVPAFLCKPVVIDKNNLDTVHWAK